MKVEDLNSKIIHDVVSLLKTYKDTKADTPSEFLEENISSYRNKEHEEDDQALATFGELFLQVVKHEKFLENFVNRYYKKNKRIIHTDKYLLMVLSYVMVFFTNNEQLNAVADVLTSTSVRKASALASFLSHEAGILLLTQAAACYFDQDYIKDVIAVEVLKDSNLFLKLHSILQKTKVEPPKENYCKPQHLNVLAHIKKVPRPPCNTADNESLQFVLKAHSVPRSTYVTPSTEKNLQEVHEKNKQKSLNLLEKAQMVPSHLTQPLRAQESSPPQTEVSSLPLVKAKPPPVFKEPDLPVKMNTSSVLRQAVTIVKEEEEEIKRVKNLTVGALDYTQFENLFNELKNKEEEEYLKSIEKKHLKGLSTYEEAILAKRSYLKKNKEKRALFEEQKKELEERLKEYKQIEEEKIREIVQKIQEIQKNVDEKKQDLLNKKQQKAKKVTEESRSIMLEIFKKKTEELHKKIELIKEIRTLNSFKTRKKEFDDTETMNIGLLCEMSIAELNERLAMVRAEMKEELELRQKRIKQEKVRQQDLLKEMQKLIESNHVQRKRIGVTEQKSNRTVQPDEEILTLRKKLEEAREKRKAGLV